MKMDLYQEFIGQTRYAKSNERNFQDIIARYADFVKKNTKINLEKNINGMTPLEAILNLDVMPAMRLVASAGIAAEFDNTAGYNCSYLVLDSIGSFTETMHLLMNGCGVGFSIEDCQKLPKIKPLMSSSLEIVVDDSKLGWCKSLYMLLLYLFDGRIPHINYSKVRAKGEPLKTFGGFASGPESIKELFDFIIEIFKGTSKLSPLNCYDIITKIASIIECGGLRRAATMCLFSKDTEIFDAKKGNWYETAPHRSFSNNSLIIEDPRDLDLVVSQLKDGAELGFFNRRLAQQKEPHGRVGLNPCGEILLIPKQFCNLTEVVCRPENTLEDIKRKLKIATYLGSVQSTLTSFRYLSADWGANAEDHRLLGVSLTGIYDCPKVLNTSPEELRNLKQTVREAANEYAKELDISIPIRCTTIKPSGTVSQLVDCTPGITPPISEYYIRHVHKSGKIPINLPTVENGQIYQFPRKSKNWTGIVPTEEQLSIYDKFYENYVDHNASTTIYVDDWDWLRGKINKYIGLAFLPRLPVGYKNLPFQPCTKEEYDALLAKMPDHIEWPEELNSSETTAECSGGLCRI